MVLQRRLDDGSIEKYVRTIAERYSLNVQQLRIFQDNAYGFLVGTSEINDLLAETGIAGPTAIEVCDAFCVEVFRPLYIERRAEIERQIMGTGDDATPQFFPPEVIPPNIPSITRTVVVGPSDAKYPCSKFCAPLAPYPTMGEAGGSGWHAAEIQTLIAIWQRQHPTAKIVNVQRRNDLVYSLRMFADVTYEQVL